MAENESLDLRKSPRWRRLLDAVKNGTPANQMALLAKRCLIETVNALSKPLYAGGPPQVPLAELLDAVVHNPQEIKQIVRRCHGHDFVLLLCDSTLGVVSCEVAAENFLSAIVEKYCAKIEIQAAKDGGQYTLPRIRSQLDQMQAHLRSDKKKLAQQLAANPNRTLRRTGLNRATESRINLPSVLKESLLGTKR